MQLQHTWTEVLLTQLGKENKKTSGGNLEASVQLHPNKKPKFKEFETKMSIKMFKFKISSFNEAFPLISSMFG